jgi:hypothetical protein
MGSINRCAIGVGPQQPLIDWSRQVSGECDLAWSEEDHSLYLLPAYETPGEGEQRLQEVDEEIFCSELESWSLDTATWPSPRSYALFRDWFAIRFYDLVEDLSDEELVHEDEMDVDSSD